MIFSLNQKEHEQVDKLLMTSEYNDNVATFLNEEVINQIVTDEVKKDYRIQELKISDYPVNQQYQNIKRPIKIKDYELKDEVYQPYQCFLYDDISVDEDDYFLIKNYVGYFTKAYRFLTLQKDGTTWMSLIPHEINTMKKDIKNVSKTIYIFGLGLAYFPSLVSQNVAKIIIIEKDRTVIEIFKKNILPHLAYPEKYTIIEEDAFTYARTLPLDAFAFIDLWHNVDDGLDMYIRLKKVFKNHQHIHYWIEESLIAAIRHLFINLIEEELYHPNEFDYKTAKNLPDEIINKLHHHFVDKKITSYQELKELLTTDYLKQLVTCL
ncbi:MAG: hypothetical protein MJ208_02305 [Bacilli bacterium]|nr:hypothetical protein [Bacilli bacterium]